MIPPLEIWHAGFLVRERIDPAGAPRTADDRSPGRPLERPDDRSERPVS